MKSLKESMLARVRRSGISEEILSVRLKGGWCGCGGLGVAWWSGPSVKVAGTKYERQCQAISEAGRWSDKAGLMNEMYEFLNMNHFYGIDLPFLQPA
jgi:hypothetical protein